jgi:cytochrome P450
LFTFRFVDSFINRRTFVLAGLATTAATLSRTLYLLAAHPDVQERLRSEINDINQDGVDLSYDEIMALPILDAVYKETARVSVTLVDIRTTHHECSQFSAHRYPAGTTLMRSSVIRLFLIIVDD